MKNLSPIIMTIAVALPIAANAQTPVGAELPEVLGFTQAVPSFPLQNLSEFNFNDREGEVIVVVYHASW